MTAAELATAMATQGASEHCAEGEGGWWEHGGLPGLDVPDWLRPHLGGGDECPSETPEDDPWYCSRKLGHPGRHIAVGAGVAAAWPGTHEPTLADLDDPKPAAEQTPTLTLPAGWERVDKKDGTLSYCVRSDERLPDIYADAEDDGVEWDGSGGATTEDARTFAARLVEAAGIVEQLRAGAR